MNDTQFIAYCRAKYGNAALRREEWARLLSLAGRTGYAPGAYLCDLADLRVENGRLKIEVDRLTQPSAARETAVQACDLSAEQFAFIHLIRQCRTADDIARAVTQYDVFRNEQIEALKRELIEALKWSAKPMVIDGVECRVQIPE